MPENGIVTVAVGRFDPLVHSGLMAILGADRRIDVLADNVGEDQLEPVVKQQAPRVLVMAEAAKSSLLERLGEIAPATRLLVLAHHPSRAHGMRVLAAGATCVAWNASAADILAAFHLVAQGQRLFVSASGHRVERRYPSDVPALTPRERDVLRHLSRGRSHAEIARDLRIGVRTVHTYAAQLRDKLNVRGKHELIGMPLPDSHAERD